MSARVYVNAVNWVFDTLKAQAGGAGTISYVNAANVLLGSDLIVLKDRTPCVIVRLALPNAVAEDWGAMLRERDGDLVVTASLAMHPEDKERPYGSATKRGILTFAEDVANIIENATNGLRLGGASISVSVTFSNVVTQGEGLYLIDVDLRAKIRFTAGAR